jgi:RNA polymerase sigma-70 factor (ECF subfamily)
LEERQRAAVHQAMIALAQGDRSAFGPVFTTLWPLLRRFTLRVLGDAAEAEDAAQAALLKVLLHAAEFDPARDAVTWALGLAFFECLSLRKRALRRRETGDAALFASVAAREGTPEDQVIERDLRAAATSTLGILSRKDVEILEAAIEGWRPAGPERARAAFRKRVQRAIDRVRVAWRRKHGTD